MRPMSGTALPQIIWMLATLLVVSVQIMSAVLLLREKHIGPWLMLIGSMMSLLSGLASHVFSVFYSHRVTFDLSTFYNALSAFGYFSYLVFGIGLLLHALRQKGRADRIAELEAILHSRNQQE